MKTKMTVLVYAENTNRAGMICLDDARRDSDDVICLDEKQAREWASVRVRNSHDLYMARAGRAVLNALGSYE